MRSSPKTLARGQLFAVLAAIGLVGCTSELETSVPLPVTAAMTTVGNTQDGSSALSHNDLPEKPKVLRVGAEVSADQGFMALSDGGVAVVLNHASLVDGRHLLDVLAQSEEVQLVAAYAPEHGVRADAPAGAEVTDQVDPTTGIEVLSLYQPGASEAVPPLVSGADVVVFDLQDVGARVYTYISTMGTAMMMAAQADARFVVLDRPNPLGGHMIDGPVRNDEFSSFVGRYPLPLVHGMTVGELALAIQGEAWLPGLQDLDVHVVPMQGWERSMIWAQTGRAWVAPSPSLPTAEAAAVYPATVLFEATSWSVGRGTDTPFSVIGAPGVDGERLASRLAAYELPGVSFTPTSFVPQASAAVPNPKHEGTRITGVHLDVTDSTQFSPYAVAVHLLAEAQALTEDRTLGSAVTESSPPPALIDRPAFFDLLAGTDELRHHLHRHTPPGTITDAVEGKLTGFATLRSPYLLYD